MFIVVKTSSIFLWPEPMDANPQTAWSTSVMCNGGAAVSGHFCGVTSGFGSLVITLHLWQYGHLYFIVHSNDLEFEDTSAI